MCFCIAEVYPLLHLNQNKTLNMKTLEGSVSCSARIQKLRKIAKRKAMITSVRLMFIAFAAIMIFGGIMKIVNS